MGDGNRKEYRIRPGSAGDDAWEHLVFVRKQSPQTEGEVPVTFTPDGDWLVYHDLDSNNKDALFRVSSGGGEPQRLGDFPTSSPNSYINISLDGRHILIETIPANSISTDSPQLEYWILENFRSGSCAAASRP